MSTAATVISLQDRGRRNSGFLKHRLHTQFLTLINGHTRFVCNEAATVEFIGDIFEPQSCEYTIVVHTARFGKGRTKKITYLIFQGFARCPG